MADGSQQERRFEIASRFEAASSYAGLVCEVNDAMDAFQRIRNGDQEEFIDSTGLRDSGDDDGVRPTLITADNVDGHEATFRVTWAWLCPSLAVGDQEKGPIHPAVTEDLTYYAAHPHERRTVAGVLTVVIPSLSATEQE